jgi:hypothetical protein
MAPAETAEDPLPDPDWAAPARPMMIKGKRHKYLLMPAK